MDFIIADLLKKDKLKNEFAQEQLFLELEEQCQENQIDDIDTISKPIILDIF